MSRLLLPIICLSLLVRWTSAEGQVLPEPVSERPNDDAAFQQCISDLASPEFSRRQRALKTLSGSSPEQVRLLGLTIGMNPDNEVVRRVIEILERLYGQPDRGAPEVAAASEAIEVAAKSDRWFAAEAARDILKRHWKRRVELAATELLSLGASLTPKDPEELWKGLPELEAIPFQFRNARRSALLKVFIGQSWPKSPRTTELMRRMESLGSVVFLRDVSRIAIILVDGHTLTLEEIGELKGVFGDAHIQERGRVSLGIHADFPSANQGVTVKEIEPNTSAEGAGIQPGDTITAIDKEAVADFEALVTHLKRFQVGDQITLTVIKGNRLGENTPVEVPVTLKGWQ